MYWRGITEVMVGLKEYPIPTHPTMIVKACSSFWSKPWALRERSAVLDVPLEALWLRILLVVIPSI